MSRRKLISIARANYAKEKALGETMQKKVAKNIYLIRYNQDAKIVFSLIKDKYHRSQKQNKGS